MQDKTRNPMDKITIQNRFVFAAVMKEPKNSLPFLQRLFPNLDIREIRYIEAEKTTETTLEAKGVRFDVYLKDQEDRAFTLEMQVVNTGDLPLRSRYYGSVMDIDIMKRGMLYEELPPTYVVFICPFDLFGLGLHRYSFQYKCMENDTIELNDRTTKIFLNTKSRKNDVPNELRAFLDYIDGVYEENKDDYVDQLDEAVRIAKMDANQRRVIMTYEEELRYEVRHAAKAAAEKAAKAAAKAAASEARKVALLEGLEEGRAEGRAEERINTEREKKRADAAEELLKAYQEKYGAL